MKANDILCIVVTYNRLQDLQSCILSLQQQTYQDFDIIIVNNGSTDGTNEYLNSIASDKLQVLHQTNLGGAGGFYAGMKYGYDNNYKWLWLMDDDGIPDKNQLEELVKYRHISWYLNAIVLDKENNEQFAFIPDDKNIKLADIQKETLTNKIVHPFNGTFYNIEMIKKIGFIKKEMFIWGDEKEYTFRAIKNGIKPITVTTAKHYHPKEKGIKESAIPFIHSKRIIVIVKPQHLSHYYYRNLGYIDKTYRTIPKSIKLILINSVYFIRKCKFAELWKFYTFYFKGRKNDYFDN